MIHDDPALKICLMSFLFKSLVFIGANGDENEFAQTCNLWFGGDLRLPWYIDLTGHTHSKGPGFLQPVGKNKCDIPTTKKVLEKWIIKDFITNIDFFELV